MTNKTIEQLVKDSLNNSNGTDYNCDFNNEECPFYCSKFCPMKCNYAMNKHLPIRTN